MGLLDLYNSGKTELQYPQVYNSTSTYIDSRKNVLRNSLKITNLDTTDPGLQGGIPYKQAADPTVYPPNVNHIEPIRGWFAEPGQGPKKFIQRYSAADTYLDLLKP